MIRNNHEALTWVAERQGEPLTLFGLQELHRVITRETVDPLQEGRVQQPGDERVAVVDRVTGTLLHRPPPAAELPQRLESLCAFCRGEGPWLHPIVRACLAHFALAWLHPFYDGNGRTGRIINILYLVQHGLLGSPVLYLSRYINQNKADYYRLLQTTRDTGNWEDWLLYMLDGVEQTAHQTTTLVVDIYALMQRYKHRLRTELPKIYSQDLINNLFRHPYTKIEFLAAELQVVRQTAARYLDEVAALGLLTKHKLGKDNYYLNDALYQRLHNVSENTEAQL